MRPEWTSLDRLSPLVRRMPLLYDLHEAVCLERARPRPTETEPLRLSPSGIIFQCH